MANPEQKPGDPPGVLLKSGAPPRHPAFSKGRGVKKGDKRDPWATLVRKHAISSEFTPFKEQAEEFVAYHIGYLAKNVGAGMCGPDVATIVRSAAVQYARAQFIQQLAEKQTSDDKRVKLFQMASAQENHSRSSLLTAYELCARTAGTRKHGGDAHEELARALASGGV